MPSTAALVFVIFHALAAASGEERVTDCDNFDEPAALAPNSCSWKVGGRNHFGCKVHELVCTDSNADLVCFLPKDKGPCSTNVRRFYFNPVSGLCLPFVYGGCQGNDNRFSRISQCRNRCYKYLQRIQADRPIESCDQLKCPIGFSCQLLHLRYTNIARCLPLGRPGLLKNNFEICSQSLARGFCKENILQYYYDRNSGECRPFEYSGCQGNLNRFSSVDICQEVCAGVPMCPKLRLQKAPRGCSYEIVQDSQFCNTAKLMCPRKTKNATCPDSYRYKGPPRPGCAWISDIDIDGCPIRSMVCHDLACATNPCDQSKCEICINQLDGHSYECINNDTCIDFQIKILCQSLICDKSKICAIKDGFPQCVIDDEKTAALIEKRDCVGAPLRGDCQEKIVAWFYRESDKQCLKFTYSGCGGNSNRFASLEACQHQCVYGRQCPSLRKHSHRPSGCQHQLTVGLDGCPVLALRCATNVSAAGCARNACSACQKCVPRRYPCVGTTCHDYKCLGGCGQCETCSADGKCLSTKVPCTDTTFNPCKEQSCPRHPNARCQKDACNCRKAAWILPNNRAVPFGQC